MPNFLFAFTLNPDTVKGMHIQFFGPFEKISDNEVEFELTCPTTLREFISIVAFRYPGFKRYVNMKNDSSLSAHISFLRDGKLLKLSDQLQNQDNIQVLLPVTGG
jgi:molybdopterin converting factor small subunit